MLRFLVTTLLFALTTGESNAKKSTPPAPPAQTIVDYLRTTPANVTGTVRFLERKDLYSSGMSAVRVIPTKTVEEDLSFNFSETHLKLTTDKALRISVLGLSMTIRELSYNRSTGKFTVRTNTPLGIGAGVLNRRIEKELEAEYKPKLERAFRQLTNMRKQRTLSDANTVLQSILGIFSDGGPASSLPPIVGDMSLNFLPPRDRRLGLGNLNADIKANDVLSAQIQFQYAREKFLIKGLAFSSGQGVRITPGRTSIPEFASMLLKDVKIDRRGVKMDYDIGAEEMIAGFTVLIGLIDDYTSPPGTSCQDCDVRLKGVRAGLDLQMQQEIARFIRAHRPSLLAAGASSRLLNALD